MHCSTSYPGKRVLPSQGAETEDKVHDLEDWYGANGAIEICCKKIPEDLWPEEAF